MRSQATQSLARKTQTSDAAAFDGRELTCQIGPLAWPPRAGEPGEGRESPHARALFENSATRSTARSGSKRETLAEFNLIASSTRGSAKRGCLANTRATRSPSPREFRDLVSASAATRLHAPGVPALSPERVGATSLARRPACPERAARRPPALASPRQAPSLPRRRAARRLAALASPSASRFRSARPTAERAPG